MTITLSIIEQSVLQAFNIDKSSFRSGKRLHKIVEAKKILCYQAVDIYGYSYSAVGEYLELDHSTIIHHVKTARGFIKNNPIFINNLQAVDTLIDQLCNTSTQNNKIIEFKLDVILQNLNEQKQMIETILSQLNSST